MKKRYNYITIFIGYRKLTEANRILCNIFTATVRPSFVCCCFLSVLRGDFLPFPTSIVCFRSWPLYTFPKAPSPMILCKEMSSKRTSHGSKSSELDLKNIHRRIKSSGLPKIISSIKYFLEISFVMLLRNFKC